MGDNTLIEWATHTFNGWIGCTAVSPACDHCYAEQLATTRLGVQWGPHAQRRRTTPRNWTRPLAWNRKAQAAGERHRVFSASLADWMDNAVPIDWLTDLLELVRVCDALDWLLLTKRPQLILRRLEQARQDAMARGMPQLAKWLGDWLDGDAPHQVWLGTTTENQTQLEVRAPHLLASPARIHFLSCEPLLDALRIPDHWLIQHHPGSARIDWIIAGGESGPHARPSHPDWYRRLRDQCESLDVPFFFKQWGEWSPTHPDWPRATGIALADDGTAYQPADLAYPDGPRRGEAIRAGHDHAHLTCMYHPGKKAAGHLLDGREHRAVPA